MTTRTITIIIMCVNLSALIAWDFYAYRTAGSLATISRILRDAVYAYPGLAIAIGALIGHFWFSQTIK